MALASFNQLDIKETVCMDILELYEKTSAEGVCGWSVVSQTSSFRAKPNDVMSKFIADQLEWHYIVSIMKAIQPQIGQKGRVDL